MKAVLGFLNAEGGKIFAGVADDGTVVGLEADIKHTGKSKDQLLRYIVDKLNSYIGPATTSTIPIDWHEIGGKDVLLFDVPRSPTPVFPLRKVAGKDDVLYVRQNANVVPFQRRRVIQLREATIPTIKWTCSKYVSVQSAPYIISITVDYAPPSLGSHGPRHKSAPSSPAAWLTSGSIQPRKN